MERNDLAAARESARLIVQRIVGDEAFAGQLRHDPRGTLHGAGFPEWALDDFVANDLGLDADVEGYSMDRCAVTSLLWGDVDGIEMQ